MHSIKELEASKYQRMWGKDDYRIVSPGVDSFKQSLRYLDINDGDTLLDFGAGTARATKLFIDMGVDALALDIADNANEFVGVVPYEICCLWDIPSTIKPAKFGYCCDVLEHIPVDMLDRTLRSIASKVTHKCFFKVACFPDRSGKLIGETLHLSIFDPFMWAFKLNAYFKCRIISTSGSYLTAICDKS